MAEVERLVAHAHFLTASYYIIPYYKAFLIEKDGGIFHALARLHILLPMMVLLKHV